LCIYFEISGNSDRVAADRVLTKLKFIV
jgi:hypothetical protein